MDARTHNEVRPGRGLSLVEDNPDQIKRDIDRTRAHLDETVTELSARLSPRRMAGEFMDMFAGSEKDTAGHPSATDIVRSVRDNPVPAALIGAGIAWFLFNRSRNGGSLPESKARQVGKHGERDWLAPGATYEPNQPGRDRSGQSTGKDDGQDEGPGLRQRGSEVMEAGRERVGNVGRTVRHWAEEAGESVSHAAQKVGSRISDTAHAARDHMPSGDGLHLRERAQHTARGVRDVVEDHPVVFGAAALCIGLIAGLSVPPTRTEREVMGPVRDDLMDEAGRKLREDVAPRVKEAAKAVAREAGEAMADKTSEEVDDDDDASFTERVSKVASAGIHRAGEKTREELHRQNQPRGGDQDQFDTGKSGSPSSGSTSTGSPGGGSLDTQPGRFGQQQQTPQHQKQQQPGSPGTPLQRGQDNKGNEGGLGNQRRI